MLVAVFKHHWLKYMKYKNAQKCETPQCTFRWNVLAEYDSITNKSVLLGQGHFWKCVFSFVEHAALWLYKILKFLSSLGFYSYRKMKDNCG